MTTKEYIEGNIDWLGREIPTKERIISLVNSRLEWLKEQWLQEIFSRYPDSKEQSPRVIIPVGKREIIIPIPLI